MAVKIKLMRVGKVRNAQYRIVVADARTRRNGRGIETIGEYYPKNEPSVIKLDSDRAQYWLGVGAQPTEAVMAIFKVTGDWQKFKGLPEPEEMKYLKEKPTKLDLFNKALEEASNGPTAEAITSKRKADKKAKEEAEKAKKEAAEKAAEKAKEDAEKAEKAEKSEEDADAKAE